MPCYLSHWTEQEWLLYTFCRYQIQYCDTIKDTIHQWLTMGQPPSDLRGGQHKVQNQQLSHMDLTTSRWKDASKRWAEDQYWYLYMFSSVLIRPDLKSYLSLTAWLPPSLPHGSQSSHVLFTFSDGFITTSNSSHNWQWVVQCCCIEFFVASAVRPLAQSLHNMVCLPCLVDVYFHSHTPCLLVLLVLLKNLHLQW